MVQFQEIILINRPIEEVFDFTVDEKYLPRWQSNLVKGEQLTQGPIRVGTQVREIRRMGPFQNEILAEIIEYEPDRCFTIRTLTNPRTTISYMFEPSNGGTRILYNINVETNGNMKMMEPEISNEIKKVTQTDFLKLKQVLEG